MRRRGEGRVGEVWPRRALVAARAWAEGGSAAVAAPPGCVCRRRRRQRRRRRAPSNRPCVCARGARRAGRAPVAEAVVWRQLVCAVGPLGHLPQVQLPVHAPVLQHALRRARAAKGLEADGRECGVARRAARRDVRGCEWAAEGGGWGGERVGGRSGAPRTRAQARAPANHLRINWDVLPRHRAIGRCKAELQDSNHLSQNSTHTHTSRNLKPRVVLN